MENDSKSVHAEKPTYLQKLEILKSLNNSIFDFKRIEELLKYTVYKDMEKPIMKKVIEQLIELDTFISASHEILSDEDWEQICISCDTPGASPSYQHPEEIFENKENSKEIKEKLEFLNLYFLPVLKCLEKMKIELALEILTPLFRIKTRNIQFLLFFLAKKSPSQVFGFLISRLKKDPKTYAPFFGSLLVRLDLDSDFKMKCYQAFLKHFLGVSPNKSINYVVLAQSFLYIHCFKDFKLSDSSSKIVKMIFSEGYASLMNKNVILKFSEFYDEVIPAFYSLKNECLYSFPFDIPISRAVADIIQDSYVLFK